MPYLVPFHKYKRFEKIIEEGSDTDLLIKKLIENESMENEKIISYFPVFIIFFMLFLSIIFCIINI